MNETLILILGETPDAPVKWAFVSEGRVVLADIAGDTAALESIAVRAGAARRIVAVLRGEDAALRAMPAPPRSDAQFRAAAGFLLEDELSESVSAVHVASGRHESGAGQVVAVKKSVLEGWRDALKIAGLSPDIMTVDFALLPAAPGRAIILNLPDRMVGAIGLSGFAIERPMADTLVSSFLADDALTEIIYYGDRAIEADQREDIGVDLHAPLNDEALFSLFASTLERKSLLNLLRGEYRKKRDWKGAAGPWRRVGLLAAACLGALMFTSIADSVRSLNYAKNMNVEVTALHQAAFPDAANADPRGHARSILASGGGAPVFLAISTRIAESLDEVEGVQVDRIRYNAERGEYAVNLRFAAVEQLDAFKRSLEAQGVSAAEAGGVRRSGGYYLGEMRVSL